MPITVNALAISAQEVPTFKASPLTPSKRFQRIQWLPNLFLLFLRIAARFRSLCAHDQIGGQPPLYIALEIPDEILLSLFVAAPDAQYPYQAYLSLSISR